MKSITKRVLSVLLCMALVLAVMPMAFAADTTRLYCVTPNGWGNCNVYWWGSSQSNPGWPGEAMTKGADGVWYYDVPSDASNVIFNNGNGTQTADLVMPTDSNVQFTYAAKTWGPYGGVVEVPETVYYLRGTMNNWGLDNPMTKVDDNTYTITMDLAAGTYEYKAAIEDWSWSCPGGGNLSLTLAADDSVTFTLNLAANSLTYTLGSGTVVETVYYLRGNMNNWDTSTEFVKQADGTYAVTVSLDAGTYEYKAAVADWSWSVPGGDNAVLELAEAADVTFVLDVAAGTLTNNAPVVEPTYNYYVAGSEELCGVAWDPAANQMENIYDNVYQITFEVYIPGTYEYKITTGSWATPSYGYGDGNYTVVVKNAAFVCITFDADTKEVTCEINEFGANVIKFQLNADASADDETVNLRLITYVESLDYSKVEFVININGVEAFAPCQTVYEAINANGQTLTCEDIFNVEGYLVTYTIENIPAEYYDADINVNVCFYSTADNIFGEDVFISGGRSLVLSDILA